jgi:hypothetical protein
MILLVTPSERAVEYAAALQEATGEPCAVAESLARATARLRAGEYGAVVLDQSLMEAEPDQASSALEHLETGIPVPVNLAICGRERLAREVVWALQRGAREVARARAAAARNLRSELKGTVTALLLSSELVREIPGLPAAAAGKLQALHELVERLRRELEGAGTAEAAEEEEESDGTDRPALGEGGG